jgi:hypothetical protein
MYEKYNAFEKGVGGGGGICERSYTTLFHDTVDAQGSIIRRQDSGGATVSFWRF